MYKLISFHIYLSQVCMCIYSTNIVLTILRQKVKLTIAVQNSYIGEVT